MKTLHKISIAILLLPTIATAQLSEDNTVYKEVLAMDTAFFDAYNTCDLESQAQYIAEDIEFFHDKGGFTNDKEGLIESLERNICGKVTRALVPGSFEVHEIPGYGAVAMGYHTFFNKLEPDAPQKPGRFVNLLTKNDEGVWQMQKVISLH